MGCPIHIWVPALAALAPIARVARDQVRALRVKPAASTPRRRVVQRWAPVGAAAPASRRDEPAG
jgi:hypothetical protein